MHKNFSADVIQKAIFLVTRIRLQVLENFVERLQKVYKQLQSAIKNI